MIAAVRALLLRLGTQDAARTNAAQASVRLRHRRRQVDDTDAYLRDQLQHRAHPAQEHTAQADTTTDPATTTATGATDRPPPGT